MSLVKIEQTLLKELDSLSSGKSDIKRARAVVKICAQSIYINRLKLEEKRINVDIGKNIKKIREWKDFSFKAKTI